MPKLPDIPVESWAADQADLFTKQVKGYFPALEFQAVTNDQNSEISPDWPFPGGQDNWEAAAQQAAEEERRKQEEQLRVQQEAQIEAEAAQHQSLLQQAWNTASGLGIPSPDQAFGMFQNAAGSPPGTGDNSSTTGAFEQGTPFAGGLSTPQDTGQYPPESAYRGMIDTRNAPVEADPSMASATPLQDSYPTPTGETIRPMTGPEQRGFALRNAPSALFNGARNIGSSIVDEAQALPGHIADVGRGIGQLALGDNAVTELGAGVRGLHDYVYEPLKAGAEAAPGVIDTEAHRQPDNTPEGTVERVNPLYRGVKSYQNIEQGIADPIGRKLGVELGFTDAPVMKSPTTGEAISALDIAGTIGQAVLDPTNLIGAGEGAAAARAVERGAEDAISPAGRLATEQLRLGARDDPGGVGGALLAANRAPSALFSFGRDVAGRTAGLGSDLAREASTGARDAIESIPHIQDVADSVLGAGKAADVALGQGVDAISPAARGLAAPIGRAVTDLGRYAYENPDKAAGLAAGAISEYTSPDDATPEERGLRALAGGGAAMLGIKARKLPMAEAGAEGFRRMYHGTGGEFGLLDDAAKFDPDGLFGPAHYITSSPVVAGQYAEEAVNRFNDARPNIRPTELDDRAYLFHADKIVPQADFERIAKAAMRLYGDDPTWYTVAQDYLVAARQGEKSIGAGLYDSLAADFGNDLNPTIYQYNDETGLTDGAKRAANAILSEAGFDGVYYKGGDRIGSVDDNGRVIQHDAVAIFPDKLDAIRNAFTQEHRASFAPPIAPVAQASTGATAGGIGAEQTQDEDQPTDYGRIALGAGLGAIGVLGAKRIPEELRIPARGLWKDRLAAGLEIPEHASPEEAARIAEAFDNTTQHLLTAQNSRRAQIRIRNTNRAKDYWNEYESLRDGVTGDAGTAEADIVRPASAREAPVPEEAASQLPERPAPLEGESPVSPTEEEAPFGSGPRDETSAPVSELDFADEPLPTSLDPNQRLDPEEAGSLIKQVREDVGASPADTAWLDRQATNLLSKPKSLTGKNIDMLLTTLGERRAVARYGDAAAQGRAFADKHLRAAGLIAPEAEAGSTTVLSALAPTPTAATDTLGRAANVLTAGAQMGITGGMGAAANQELNPDDPNAAIKGFAAGALIPAAGRALVRRGLEAAGKDIPEEVGTLAIFGPSNGTTAKGLRGNVRLNSDPSLQQFVSPAPTGSLPPKGLIAKIHDFWREKGVTGLADEQGVLEGLQNDLARSYKDQTGKLLPVEQLASSIKRLNSDRAVEMDVQDKFRPHLQTFHKLGVPNEFVDNYLLNLQNIDIAQDQSKNMQVPPGSGVVLNVPNLQRKFPGSNTYANAITWNQNFENSLQKLLTPAQYQEFQGAVKGVHDFGDHILQYLLSSELIDQPTYNDLRARFPHYVPTRLVKYLNDENFISRGKSLTVNGNTLHELTHAGSADEAMSPLAALLGQAYTAHAAAQKNIVANRLVDMWAAASGVHQLPGGYTPPSSAMPGLSNLDRRVANFAEGMVPIAPGAKITNEENAIKLFRAGVPIRMEVSKELGDIVKFPSPAHVPVISGMMSMFRAGATSRNPAFITANALLDLSNVMAREVAREGGPTIPNIAEVLKTWGQSMGEYVLSPQAMRDMYTGTYRGDMAEALRGGGGMSGGHFAGGALRPKSYGTLAGVDLQGLRESLGYGDASELEQGIQSLQRGYHEVHSAADVVKVLKDAALFKWAETIGERIELAGRVPAYRLEQQRGAARHTALQNELSASLSAHNAAQAVGTPVPAGMRPPITIQDDIAQNSARTDLQSTLNFRDTTLDFDKGGNITKAINQWIPFFNVGVQSLADLHRAASQNPVAYPMTAALGIIGPMTAAEAWNQGDAQRAKDYADVPNYIKDQGMVVMLPEHVRDLVPDGYEDHFSPAELNQEIFPASYDKQGNRQPQFFHFRYRQLAPFAMATRAMLQNTLYANAPTQQERRNVSELLSSGFSQLLPIGANSVADAATGLMPPALSTGTQLAFDRDTFHGDRRIATAYGDERATPLSHAASDLWNTIGPGAFTNNLESRPSQAEFALRDLGSGLAGAYMGASQIPAQLEGKEPTNLQNMPFLGGLANRWVKNSMGGIAQDAEANTTTESADKILRDAGIRWRPTPAAPAVSNIPLTRAEYGAMQTKINETTDIVIHQIAALPEWQHATPTDKKAIMEYWVGKNREKIEQEFAASTLTQDEMRRRLQSEIDAGHLTSTGRR